MSGGGSAILLPKSLSLSPGIGMTGRPGYHAMEVNGRSTVSHLVRTPHVPLQAKGLLAFQGRHGIASVVRWSLCPVIFGVDLSLSLYLSLSLSFFFFHFLHVFRVACQSAKWCRSHMCRNLGVRWRSGLGGLFQTHVVEECNPCFSEDRQRCWVSHASTRALLNPKLSSAIRATLPYSTPTCARRPTDDCKKSFRK